MGADWAQIGRRQKAAAVLCSAVELLAAVLFAGYSVASMLLAAAVPGPVDQYYDWAAKPGLVVGVFLAVTAAGVLVWLRLGPRRPGSLTVVSVGLALALVAGGTGAVVMYERATPKASLLAAVQQMKAPVGTARDRVTYGLVPVEGALVADGPDSSERSSGAVRSWQLRLTRGACAWTGRLADAWADRGSVTPLPVADDTGVVCQWSARKNGWQALVQVVAVPGPGQKEYDVFQ
ncbi:MAG TPA: hypothetical protein VME46_12560, partial [Acidimicrobiales bacterium]|nr:hypothetical protein [Acidimicrobiales bacterium]